MTSTTKAATRARAWLVACALWTPAATQIDPGHFIGVQRSTVAPGSGSVFAYDPLSGTARQLRDPNALVQRAHAAIAGATRGQLIVATGDGATSRVFRMSLRGDAIVTATALSRSIPTSIVGLGQISDNRDAGFVIVTPRTILRLPVDGGGETTLIRATTTDTFTAATIRPTGIVAVARHSRTGEAVIYSRSTTGTLSRNTIAVRTPTTITFDPTRDSFLIGTGSGELYLVDARRLTARLLTSTPNNAAITAMRFNSDQSDFAIGAAGLLYRLSGTTFSPPTNAPGQGRTIHLDYLPYESTFTTYGTPCQGTASVAPTIRATGRPFPGNATFSIDLRGGTPQSSAFLFLGLAPTDVALDAAGMPGCRLLVTPLDNIRTRTNALGWSSLVLGVPPASGLAGASVYFQWLTLAPNANALNLLASNGGRARF